MSSNLSRESREIPQVREKHLRRIQSYLVADKKNQTCPTEVWLAVGDFPAGNGAGNTPFPKEEWGELLKDTGRV